MQGHRSKEEGRGHTGEAVKYKTNPPTSGDHDPTPAEDGIYPADGPPDVEQSVHSLEHGRINIQYKAGTPENRIAQLEAVAEEEVKGTAATTRSSSRTRRRWSPRSPRRPGAAR